MNDDGYTIHLFEYQYDGTKWLLEIPARSREDAEARLPMILHARWLGDNAVAIPAPVGFLAPLLCWWRNLWRVT